MIQLFDSVYLLDGTVGKRPIYLPLLVGEWGCLLLDTGCSYHVNDLIYGSKENRGDGDEEQARKHPFQQEVMHSTRIRAEDGAVLDW
jgi:hypothetical protein